jgi:pilus assembly protein CpaB
MDRQKLFMIVGGAWISAALLTWLLYAGTKAPKADKNVSAVAVVRDIPAGTRLKKSDLKMVKVVEKDLPRTAFLDEKTAVDRVLLFPLNANDVVTLSRVASASGAEGLPATIEPGKRAISVPFTDVTGVAGLIQPRAHVDVLFTRTGSMSEAVTTTVLENVTVLSIGRNTEATSTPAGSSATTTASATTTKAATLLVTPEQARKLEWAKNQGKISLALRNPLDHGVTSDTQPTTAYDLDLAGYMRMNGKRPIPNVRDNKSWAQLTGQDEAKKPAIEKKELPKPRYVVDVYRGDKHVQEIFQ